MSEAIGDEPRAGYSAPSYGTVMALLTKYFKYTEASESEKREESCI